MPMWERRYIKKQLSQSSDAQTYTETIAPTGIVSAFLCKLSFTNGATGGGGQDVVDVVSKIEVIVNGSDVIHSLSGIEISKWNYAMTRQRMSQLRDDRPALLPFAMFPIMFGRWIGDELLCLDMSAFRSVEVKVTYSHTPGATLFVTGSAVLDIIGIFYTGGVIPKGRMGYLRTVQVRNFAGAASGDDETVLSRRYPYTKILVYAFKAATAEGVVVSDLELRANNSAMKPVAARWLDLQEQNDQEFALQSQEMFSCLRTSGGTIETRSGRIVDADSELIIAAGAAVSYPLYSVGSIAGGQVTMGGVLAAGSALAGTVDVVARSMFLRSRGIGIGNAVVLDFSRQWDLGEVLAAPSYDDLKLVLTQAAAAATIRVSTQELVPA
jgi:hypothetical protein